MAFQASSYSATQPNERERMSLRPTPAAQGKRARPYLSTIRLDGAIERREETSPDTEVTCKTTQRHMSARRNELRPPAKEEQRRKGLTSKDGCSRTDSRHRPHVSRSLHVTKSIPTSSRHDQSEIKGDARALVLRKRRKRKGRMSG
jgi:hypothetical protein